MAEGRGISAEVNCDVEDFAVDAANDFPLRLLDLIVETAYDAAQR